MLSTNIFLKKEIFSGFIFNFHSFFLLLLLPPNFVS